ncbi:hypothetical protein O3P69_016468 [Scylla paramamosain]|uniref:Uncharacterized protein n=1 Tax=Scylla paramamosain TaxID=85552 RepID=A0AAW0TFY6_SCYPA
MRVVCSMRAAKVVVVLVLAWCWGAAKCRLDAVRVAVTPKGNDERSHCVCGSSDYSRLPEQFHRTQSGAHISKTTSVTNTFPGCKEDNTSFNDIRSSEAYPFNTQAGGRKPRGTRSVLTDKGSTFLYDGQAQVTQSSKTFVSKYQPIEINIDNSLTSPIYSSLLIEKGVAFSVFFWVYLAAFLYVVCYFLSSFITPFSILGFIMKVLLVHYFPAIIQLELFRVADYILACVLDYLA